MSLVIDRTTKAIAQNAIQALAACNIGKAMRYDPGMVGGIISGKKGKSQNILPIQEMVSPSGVHFTPHLVLATTGTPKGSTPLTAKQGLIRVELPRSQ